MIKICDKCRNATREFREIRITPTKGRTYDYIKCRTCLTKQYKKANKNRKNAQDS